MSTLWSWLRGNSLKQYRPLPVLAAYNETSLPSSSLAGTTWWAVMLDKTSFLVSVELKYDNLVPCNVKNLVFQVSWHRCLLLIQPESQHPSLPLLTLILLKPSINAEVCFFLATVGLVVILTQAFALSALHLTSPYPCRPLLFFSHLSQQRFQLPLR